MIFNVLLLLPSSNSKLQEVESKNQELLAEIDRLKKEAEELRLRRGMTESLLNYFFVFLAAKMHKKMIYVERHKCYHVSSAAPIVHITSRCRQNNTFVILLSVSQTVVSTANTNLHSLEST